MTHATSSAAFFEAKYQQTPDPWHFATDTSELARYDAILAALAGRRFRHAFEPGCSIGVLTAHLAPLCDRLTALDFSATAAAEAALRCRDLPGVEVLCRSLDAPLPDTTFDLLVLSEIGYYFEPDAWRAQLRPLLAHLTPGGTVLAAHWLGHSPDHRIGGDAVHDILRAEPALQLEHEQRLATFRLDRFRKQANPQAQP